jgi:hypothetical protein
MFLVIFMVFYPANDYIKVCESLKVSCAFRHDIHLVTKSDKYHKLYISNQLILYCLDRSFRMMPRIVLDRQECLTDMIMLAAGVGVHKHECRYHHYFHVDPEIWTIGTTFLDCISYLEKICNNGILVKPQLSMVNGTMCASGFQKLTQR